jgi:hypothetical protein
MKYLKRAPRGRFPGLAQLELLFRVGIVAVVALGFQEKDVPPHGDDDEVRVVVDPAVQGEPPALDVPMPEEHVLQIRRLVDRAEFETVGLLLLQVEALGKAGARLQGPISLGKPQTGRAKIRFAARAFSNSGRARNRRKAGRSFAFTLAAKRRRGSV